MMIVMTDSDDGGDGGNYKGDWSGYDHPPRGHLRHRPTSGTQPSPERRLSQIPQVMMILLITSLYWTLNLTNQASYHQCLFPDGLYTWG